VYSPLPSWLPTQNPRSYDSPATVGTTWRRNAPLPSSDRHLAPAQPVRAMPRPVCDQLSSKPIEKPKASHCAAPASKLPLSMISVADAGAAPKHSAASSERTALCMIVLGEMR
jgi:hypothetical protein